ncbi:MAG: NAD(P)/FAD-dependent oxidoreductase [Deltaproteobacteria bacterium]|nr:NAD(P)/FAD-dependent oxidoreductase [Deltaproteobacteria bacterium]
MNKTDVIIIGASASGLMCAIEASKRNRKVIVLDHAGKAGSKILISGGGKCNFTNYDLDSSHYLSNNPHFCKSALCRFSQWDFIAMMERYKIPFSERDHGQLFCDNRAGDILNMLLTECEKASVSITLNAKIEKVEKTEGRYFKIVTSRGNYHSQSLVIATGGLSYPHIGASPIGYKIAEKFGINIIPPSPGLVPLTLQPKEKAHFSKLSGITVDGIVSTGRKSFRENILFTHRGLSGPAILQLSSFWQPGQEITINLLPGINLENELKSLKEKRSQIRLKSFFSKRLPKRLIATLLTNELLEKGLQEISNDEIRNISARIEKLTIKPGGTEGYRTAEVTVGGIDCNALSSKTMESNALEGLYFIGEVLDVTGELGGYNLQWAWSSGWCAGQYV